MREGRVEELLNVRFRYNANDKRLPNGLCDACRLKLYKAKNDSSKGIDIPDLSQFYVHKVHTRSSVVSPEEPCDCIICKTVRTPTAEKIEWEDVSQKMSQRSVFRKKVDVLQLCSCCFSSISPGRSHKCKQSTRLKNLSSIIQDSLLTREKDQIISTLLRKKVNEIGQNQDIVLASLVGKPMRVSMNASTPSDESCLLKVSYMKRIQSNYKFTQNQTLGFAFMIRASAKKRKAIEPNLKDKLRAVLHCLDQFFEIKSVDFKNIKVKKITNVQENVVYCKDLVGFIDYVKESRKVNQVPKNLFINSGSKKFKDDAVEKRFKDTGVNKLFIIGIANIQENY